MGQNEDSEKEIVDETSVLNNRTYIQNKCYSTAGRMSVQKLSGSTTGRKFLQEWIGLAFMKEEEFLIVSS